MKKAQKWIALLLVLSLCLCLLAACAKKAETQAEPEKAETPAANNKEPAPAETPAASEDPAPSDEPETPSAPETPAQPADEPEEDDEPVEITFYTLAGYAFADVDRIVAAINEIIEPKIGVTLNMKVLQFGDWSTQTSLDIASGVTIDLMQLSPIPPMTLNNMFASGQLTDITELLPVYAPETAALMQNYLGAYTIDGKLYGLPAYRLYPSDVSLIMRKDILQELGIEEQTRAMTSWSEFEELLNTIKAYDPMMAPIVHNASSSIFACQNFSIVEGDAFSTIRRYDTASDTLGVVASFDGGPLECVFATEGYKSSLIKAKDWYDKGLVYSDAAYATEGGQELMKSGVGFSFVINNELGAEAQSGGKYGYDMAYVTMASGAVYTSTLSSWGLVVPVTSKEPAAALKFLNLLYTDPEIQNLLVLGEEGVDYILTGSGEAKYPDDKAVNEIGWHASDFMWGSQFLVHPWEGQGGDFRDLALAANEAAEISHFLGFTANTAELSDISAAISAVTTEYKRMLECGMYTEDGYQEFMNKLQAAGVDEYIATFQAQLDAWKATR